MHTTNNILTTAFRKTFLQDTLLQTFLLTTLIRISLWNYEAAQRNGAEWFIQFLATLILSATAYITTAYLIIRHQPHRAWILTTINIIIIWLLQYASTWSRFVRLTSGNEGFHNSTCAQILLDCISLLQLISRTGSSHLNTATYIANILLCFTDSTYLLIIQRFISTASAILISKIKKRSYVHDMMRTINTELVVYTYTTAPNYLTTLINTWQKGDTYKKLVNYITTTLAAPSNLPTYSSHLHSLSTLLTHAQKLTDNVVPPKLIQHVLSWLNWTPSLMLVCLNLCVYPSHINAFIPAILLGVIELIMVRSMHWQTLALSTYLLRKQKDISGALSFAITSVDAVKEGVDVVMITVTYADSSVQRICKHTRDLSSSFISSNLIKQTTEFTKNHPYIVGGGALGALAALTAGVVVWRRKKV